MSGVRLITWRDEDARYLPLLVALVAVFAALVALLYIVFTVVRVDGDSMAPTLLTDERVLMTRGYDHPRAGDIVAFSIEDPYSAKDELIKRVVGVPGDTLTIEGDLVWVNGTLSAVAPQARIGTGYGSRYDVDVPEGTVYVMGDNRPFALDSRDFGPVPLERVEGKGVAVLLPLTRFRIID